LEFDVYYRRNIVKMKLVSLGIALGAMLLTATTPSTLAQAPRKAAPVADDKISDGVIKIGMITDMSAIFSDLAGPGSALAARMARERQVRRHHRRPQQRGGTGDRQARQTVQPDQPDLDRGHSTHHQ